MKKKSWKTTLFGALVGVGLLVQATPAAGTTFGKWTIAVSAIAAALQGKEALDSTAIKDSAKKDAPLDGPPPPHSHSQSPFEP